MAVIAIVAGIGSYLLIISRAASPPGPYIPQPNRNGITIGTDNGQNQLTDTQLQQIAANYGIVHFTHYYGNWDISNSQAAARRLVALNPNIKVYAYMSTKYWFDNNRWGVTFNPAWYLLDKNGQKIPKDPNKPASGDYYIDVSNADYRAWARDLALKWMQAAPFAGLKFDAADHIGDYPQKQVDYWTNLIGTNKIQAYNAGIDTLISSVHQDLNNIGRQVVYNGISISQIRGPDRGLGGLAMTDGAMDETFCITNGNNPRLLPVTDDFPIFDQNPNKVFMLQTVYINDTLKALRPYCLASFLMIWKPGYVYWNSGPNYSTDQLADILPDSRLNIGSPTAARVQSGNVFSRTFEHGLAYVNTGTTAASITLPRKVIEYQNGSALATYEAGSQVNIAPTTGLFFLDYDFVNSTPPLPSPPPSTTTPTTTGVAKAVMWAANTEPGSLEKDTADMQAAGITWARVNVSSTTPLSFIDSVVNTAKTHNIKILPIIGGIPENDLGTMADRQNFKSWLGGLATRYQNDISVWEIHNEENLSFWNTPVPSDPGYNAAVHNYVLHLQDAYSAIKSVDPNMQVMIGGLSSWTIEPYMDRLIAENATQWFDIMAYHPYAADPDAVIAQMNILSSKMSGTGFATKPLWVTEIGFGNADINGPYPGIVPDEQTKAAYLTDLYSKLKAWGISSPIFWYVFTEGTYYGYHTNINGYSLVRRFFDGSSAYLPSYNAMKDLWYTPPPPSPTPTPTPPPPPPPTPTPPPVGPKPGDINNDGQVNIFDLSILLSRYNTADSSADLNHNGRVDIFDLSILLSKWGG